jgi:hypothetical protein
MRRAIDDCLDTASMLCLLGAEYMDLPALAQLDCLQILTRLLL